LSGSGLGADVILSYSPSLKRQQVDGAIAHLKTTGLMAGIVSKVQAQVEAIIEANTKAEKARQAAAEKARIEAEEQQRKAVEAAKAAAAAAAKASAAKKAHAEAEAAAAADRSAKMEAARKVEAEKEVKRRAEEQLKREAAQKAAADAAKAAAEFAEKSKGLHPGVLNLLRSEFHHRTFQRIVTSDAGRKVFPTERQVELVKEMYTTCDAKRGKAGETTADDVAQFLNEIIGKHNAEYQKVLEANQRQREAESKSIKARALLNEVHAALGRFTVAVSAIGQACDADPELAEIVYGDMDFKLSDYVDGMEKTVEMFRTRFGVKSRRGEIKRTEKVIPEYVEAKMVK
jgi:hypothetical protein